MYVRTIEERSGIFEEKKEVTPRLVNELYKENYSAKLVGLEKLKDNELKLFRELIKKFFAEVMDYRNDLKSLEERYIEMNIFANDINTRTLFDIHFLNPLNRKVEKLYLVRDIIQNGNLRLEMRLRSWVFSFGNENKEKLWIDERHITFLKIIDEINFLLYKRNGKIN